MGYDDGTIKWFSPDPRCIIDLHNFHVPKRLARKIRQGLFEMRVNTAWHEVLMACAARDSTWITEDIMRVYTDLHEMGYAHSVEAFKDGELAGGLYGVSIGGAFMGESMFHYVTDASKVSFVFLVNRLKERGFVLLDSQFMTEHLATLSAKNVSREEYLSRLHRALTMRCQFN